MIKPQDSFSRETEKCYSAIKMNKLDGNVFYNIIIKLDFIIKLDGNVFYNIRNMYILFIYSNCSLMVRI